MTTAAQTRSGGGLISKIIVVLLLALAIGLYLRIVMVEGKRYYSEPAPQASVRVVEGTEPAPALTPLDELKELPEDQMQLILQTFAPEMLNN